MSRFQPEPQGMPRRVGAGWLYGLLTVLQGLVVALAVVVGFWLIASFPPLKPDQMRIPLPVVIDAGVPAAGGTDAPLLTGIREIDLHRSTRSARVRFDAPWVPWLYTLFAGLACVMAVWELNLLRRVVRSVADGDAFTGANARLLRIIGILFLIESISVGGAERLFNEVILTGIMVDGARVLVDWGGAGPFGDSLITGWVVLILSEVFRQGAALREEQSLTV